MFVNKLWDFVVRTMASFEHDDLYRCITDLFKALGAANRIVQRIKLAYNATRSSLRLITHGGLSAGETRPQHVTHQRDNRMSRRDFN
jgi:hypothetical protein